MFRIACVKNTLTCNIYRKIFLHIAQVALLITLCCMVAHVYKRSHGDCIFVCFPCIMGVTEFLRNTIENSMHEIFENDHIL